MDAVKSSPLDESAKRRHVHRGEKRKKSKSKKKKSKFMKTDTSETSTDSDESSDSSMSSLDKHKKKYKAFKRASKHKRKKSDSDSSSCFQRKHQKCKKQHKKKSKHKKNKFHLTDIVKAVHKQPVECKELSENEIGPLPHETGKSMAPMTKEEWEERQSVIRRVYDPETGRNRLVKGDGEILEEIVSKERHKEINKAATFNDGEYYRKKMGL